MTAPAGGGSDLLTQLAGALGIEVDWTDQTAQPHRVSDETLRIVLAALDVPAADDEEVRRSLAEVRSRGLRELLPAHVITREGRPGSTVLSAPAGAPVGAAVITEAGARHPLPIPEPQAAGEVDGRSVSQYQLTIPGDLPAGYHTIEAWVEGTEAIRCPLVTAPDRLPAPAAGSRVYGVAAQLYSVRSESSWGLGDLGDLAEVVSWAGGVHGADFVAVNPLCAVAPQTPRETSPYLPTTKRFTDPIYLSVTAVAEYAGLPAPLRAEIDALGAAVAPDRLTIPADPLTDPAGTAAGRGLLDRDTAWAAKSSALRILFQAGRSPGREALFEVFVRDGGESLERFAIWTTLATVHGPDSRAWPEGLRHPGSPLVADAAREHASEVRFQLWLQWCLAQQLAAATGAAAAAGMRIGVVHDLPIGVQAGGADTWMLPGVFASGMSVGAPPDMFNQQGQDWSAPPMRPDRLRGEGLQRFRDQVRAGMRDAGGVRIDHVLGLFRLWWVPEGLGSGAGAYVRYDHEALVSVVVLEAVRAGAVIVGEDLGTVAAWVQEYLLGRGILGTSILWFEHDGWGNPRPPGDWRPQTMGSVTVHDLPPTAGYLKGDHVRLRGGLGLLTRPVSEEWAVDEAERGRWLEALRSGGFLARDAGPESDPEEVVLALHRYLLATPVAMAAVALTDAVGDERAQNLPGTSSQYPNWRLPLTGPDGRPLLLEDVERDPRAARLLDLMRAARGRGAPAG